MIIITIISDIITTLFYLPFIIMVPFSAWLRYSSSYNPHHYYVGIELFHTKHFRIGQNQIVQVNLSVLLYCRKSKIEPGGAWIGLYSPMDTQGMDNFWIPL